MFPLVRLVRIRLLVFTAVTFIPTPPVLYTIHTLSGGEEGIHVTRILVALFWTALTPAGGKEPEEICSKFVMSKIRENNT